MITGFQLRDKFANGRTTLENDILLTDQLTPTEKYIYLIIEMLSYKDGFCTATNIQLEELTGNTLDSIAFSIKRLKAKKYIIVDTLQSRKPKRRIFTLDRYLKAHWANELPKDCTIKKPPTPPKNILDQEQLKTNFMKFRKFLRQYLCETKYNITTQGLLENKQILIKKNGYYRNESDKKDLTREQSAEFERLMWDKREQILNSYFNKKETT